MSANWANNLDMLAQNGVIDFDAPSFVIGQNPRYIGNPEAPSPFIGPVPNAPKLEQPKIDEFKQQPANDNNMIKTPAWKKWLLGIIGVGLLGFGLFKIKRFGSFINKTWDKLTKGFKLKSVKTSLSKAGHSIGNFFKTGWEKFTKLFKK